LVKGFDDVVTSFTNKMDDYIIAEKKAGKQIVTLKEGADIAREKILSKPELQELSKTLPKIDFQKVMKENNELIKKSEQLTGYFPRIIAPEVAEQKLKNAFVGKSKVWNTKLGNELGRKTGDISLTDLNTMIKKSGIKGMDIEDLKGLFINDPAYVATVRGMRSAKAVNTLGFLKEVGKTFGSEQAEGLVQVSAKLLKEVPELKKQWFDPKVVEEVERVYKNFFDKKTAGAVLKLFDGVQNWWKAWTLSLFPSYHARNAVSNVFLNYIGDVKNPADYAKSFALQAYKQTGKEKFAKLAGFTKNKADDIIEQMEKFGVIGGGMYAVEIPNILETGVENVKNLKDFMKVLGKQFTREGKPIQLGRELGNLIEDNARIAHYLNKTSKGFIPEVASREVKKYLFDYGDLSAFERDVMKRIMPFYTFMRKNLPLQIESIIKNPRKASKIVKARKGIEELAGTSDIKLPFMSEYIKEASPIKLRQTEKGDVDIFLMQNWIPVADITRVSEPIESLVSMLSPLIKFPVENWANYNAFFKSAVEKFEGEKQAFLGTNLRKRAVLNPGKVWDIVREEGVDEGAKAVLGIDLLRNIRLLNEMNKLNPGNIFGKERKGITNTTQLQRWVRLVFGKLQRYDRQKAYSFYEWRTRGKLSKMNSSLKKAKRENNISEINILERKIRDIKDELSQAKKEAKSGKIIKSDK